VAKAQAMADKLVKYARTHGKLMTAIIAAVFSVGGMFAIARADMDEIKKSNATHERRLGIVEKESISSSTKLDDIADDVRMIKAHLIGAH
jgi:hypothetical protein